MSGCVGAPVGAARLVAGGLPARHAQGGGPPAGPFRPGVWRLSAATLPRLLPWRLPLPAGGDGFRWSNRRTLPWRRSRRRPCGCWPTRLFFVVTELRLKGLSFFAGGLDVAAAALLFATSWIAWAVDRRLPAPRGDLARCPPPRPRAAPRGNCSEDRRFARRELPAGRSRRLGDENERVALSP